jgi:hypothetical protein
VEDVLALEVAPPGNVPEALRELGFLGVEDGPYLLRRPHVELAFLALGVGVLG